MLKPSVLVKPHVSAIRVRTVTRSAVLQIVGATRQYRNPCGSQSAVDAYLLMLAMRVLPPWYRRRPSGILTKAPPHLQKSCDQGRFRVLFGNLII